MKSNLNPWLTSVLFFLWAACANSAEKITVAGTITSLGSAKDVVLVVATTDKGQGQTIVKGDGQYSVEVAAGEELTVMYSGQRGFKTISELSGTKNQEIHVRIPNKRPTYSSIRADVHDLQKAFVFASQLKEGCSKRNVNNS